MGPTCLPRLRVFSYHNEEFGVDLDHFYGMTLDELKRERDEALQERVDGISHAEHVILVDAFFYSCVWVIRRHLIVPSDRYKGRVPKWCEHPISRDYFSLGSPPSAS